MMVACEFGSEVSVKRDLKQNTCIGIICHIKSDMKTINNEPAEDEHVKENCKPTAEDEKETLDLSSQSLDIFPLQIVNTCGTLTCLLLDYNNLSVIPDTIGNLSALEIISLNGNSISSLPSGIGILKCLRELHICENDLEELPDTMETLNSLQVLSLTGNCIKHLPTNFSKLFALEELTLEENSLCNFPENFGDLLNLKSLQANNNKISVLPQTFGKLRSLENLDLSCNKIKEFPQHFGDLRNISYLDLSKNMIEELPPYFKSCVKLCKLYLDYNRISVLPSWVSCLPELLEFSLADNKLTRNSLTEKFGCSSRKLKMLNIGGNFLQELPESFGEMKNLEFVRIGSVLHFLERRNFQNGNWITDVPKSFGRLHLLKELYFDENQIVELPTEFCNLVSLEELDLGQNQLHELPEAFGNLKSLRVCILSKNKLQLLPSSFGHLSKLEDVRLDNNQIAELPESFSQLTQLKTLDFFNNDLNVIPDCLKMFTQLVRLDIDENPFNVQQAEIPSILHNTRYAPRDPALKDNWRGKSRKDMLILNKPIIVTGDDDKDSSVCHDENNTNTLEMAAQQSQSIWRKHGDKEFSRPKFESQDIMEKNTFCIPLFSAGKTSTDEKDDDPNYFDMDEEFINDVNKLPEMLKSHSEDTEEENWDDQLDDEGGQFDLDGAVTDYYLPKAEYCHLPENLPFLCLPQLSHPQQVSKTRVVHPSERGQFDDAEV